MATESKRSRRSDEPALIASVLERHETLALTVLLSLAALFRVLRWVAVAVMFNDGPVFLDLAQSLASGDWAAALSHEFHPLYPALIAAAHALLPDWELAAMTVSVIAGTAAVACLYGFTRAAFGRPCAFVAAALLAVHPSAIEYSGDIQSEGLYLALFLAVVWSLWRAIDQASPRAAAVAGLLSGLTYLTRPEGVGLMAVAGGFAVWQALGGTWPYRRAVAWVAMLALGAAFTIVPYVGWLRVDNEGWSLTQKKSVGWILGVGEPPERYAPEPDPPPVPTAPPRAESRAAPGDPSAPAARQGEHSRAVPKETPKRRPSKSAPELTLSRCVDALGDLLHTGLRALRPELLVVLAVGALIGRWKWISLREMFVLGILGLYGLVLFALALNVGYVSARHVLPPLTVAFGYVGMGLLAIAGALGERRRMLGLVLLFALIAGIGLGKSLRPDRTGSRAERQVAEWFRAQELEPGAVAVHKRRIAYYAGATAVKIPRDAGRKMMRKIRKRGADYLIISDEDVEAYRGLAAALTSEATLLHRDEVDGMSASLYALRPEREIEATPAPGSPRSP